jgi:glyoxylate carboligase
MKNINNKISGAEAVIRSLIEENVDLIYGYPGGAIMPIYDELYKFQEKINHVLTRHEQGATHAAQGFSRVSGKVGVVMATSGPGATGSVGSGMGGSGATGSVGYGGGNSSGAGVHLGGGGTPNAGHGSGHGGE